MLSYEEQLFRIGRLTGPAISRAIADLGLKPGMVGLDVGCGIGRHTARLAQAVQPGGKAIGLDISAEFLERARQQEEAKALGDRLEFRQGSLLELPFDDGAFDFLWCADCLYAGEGLPISDPNAALKELSRVVKPGGTVALAFWSGQLLFPGHPQLETRLFEAFAKTAPYLAGPPEHHFGNALGWLKNGGYAHASARSYLTEVQAPLSADEMESMNAIFGMFIEMFKGQARPADLKEINALCLPGTDRYLLDRSDYYSYIVYTVFSGEKGENWQISADSQ